MKEHDESLPLVGNGSSSTTATSSSWLSQSAIVRALNLAVLIFAWYTTNAMSSFSTKAMFNGGRGKQGMDSSDIPMLSSSMALLCLSATLVQLTLSGLVGALIWRVRSTGKGTKVFSSSPWHDLKEAYRTDRAYFWNLSQIGICNAIGALCTNVGYVFGSVSLVQLIKAMEPFAVFVADVLLLNGNGRVAHTSDTASAIGMVVFGAAFASYHEPTMNWASIVAASISNAFLPLRNVLTKSLQQQTEHLSLQRRNHTEAPTGFVLFALVSSIGACFVAILFLIALFYYIAAGSGGGSGGGGNILLQLGMLLTSAFAYCGYNGFSFLVLQRIDPVTHAILNVLKRAFVILASAISFDKPTTWKFWAGLFITLSGLLWYKHAKQMIKTRAATMADDKSAGASSRSLLQIRLVATWWRIIAVHLILDSVIMGANEERPTAFVVKSTTKVPPGSSIARIGASSSGSTVLEQVPQQPVQTSTSTGGDLGSTSADDQQVSPVEVPPLATPSLAINDEPVQPFETPKAPDTPAVTNDERRRVLVWTYPGVPKNVQAAGAKADSTLMCAYQVGCQPFSVGLSREFLDLRDLVHGTKFEPFVSGHMYYKIIHEEQFPHHIQSVTVCSMILFKNMDVVGGVGTSDAQTLEAQCQEYDPTDASSTPPVTVDFINTEEFAAIGYDSRVRKASDANSGDEVQSMAALQFMPYLTQRVDRDTQYSRIANGTSPHLIANAWYGVNANFPPPASTHDISFVAAHFSGEGKMMVSTHKDYWKRYVDEIGPVGARDTGTLAFLRSQGIPAYLSLCFTLTYHIPKPTNSAPRDAIMIVDANPNFIPDDIVARAERFYCNVPAPGKFDHKIRHEYAYNLVSSYASRAKVVITSRIHSALPALAVGAQVIFIEAKRLPGGGGGRTKGISDLFHLYQQGDEWNFDLDNLPPMPGLHRVDRYRASFWNHLKKRTQYYVDTAHLYGMVPFQRLAKGLTESQNLHDLFHFIVTTPPLSLNWKIVRAIEAVFYHHPDATVLVHSNTFYNVSSKLDLFQETGFDLQVRPYDMVDMLRKATTNTSLVERFEAKIPKLSRGPNWYSHESDILRFLVVYLMGGVYFDIDMYAQRPLFKNFTNVVGKQSAATINGAAMIFEKRHPAIKKALDFILTEYNPMNMKEWGIIGPGLVTKVAKDGPYERPVWILEPEGFQPIAFQAMNQKCFNLPGTIDLNNTYAMHLNNKFTSKHKATKPGTVCDRILHQHCIFCDEMHTAERRRLMLR